MRPRYMPPTKVSTSQIPFEALVAQIDPSWNRWKHYEIEYEFTRRNFYADPYHTGPYSGVFDNPAIIDGPYNVNNPEAVNPRTGTGAGVFTLDESLLGGPDVLE